MFKLGHNLGCNLALQFLNVIQQVLKIWYCKGIDAL